MARRKRRSPHRSRRRRRIGAMALSPTSPIAVYGSMALGYLVAAKPIASAVDKAFVNETDAEKVKNAKKMIYGGMTLGGAYFAFMDKGKKSVIKTVLSGIAVGAGLKNSLTAFGIGRIGGYGMIPAIGRGGYGQIPALGYKPNMNGYATPGTLNGYRTPGTLNSVVGKVKETGDGSGDGSGLLHSAGTDMLMG